MYFLENKATVDSFIEANLNKDAASLSLLLSKRSDLPTQYIINQIIGRQKAKSKFPFLEAYKDFVYPPQRAIEQASSETLAKFKASLYNGIKILDLSGGMGMDSIFWSQNFEELIYVEQSEELCAYAEENFKKLGIQNINVICVKGEQYLEQVKYADLIYLDPDRRIGKTRVFKLEDCSPNILELENKLIKKAEKCLVKLSPMIDISSLSKKLKSLSKILVISHKNECKEVLIELSKQTPENILVECFNIMKELTDKFSFSLGEEQEIEVEYDAPSQFIYEPNASLLKAGAYKLFANRYNLKKIAPNTHLYTAEENIMIPNCRCFKLKEEVQLKSIAKRTINVICRNYPKGSSTLKKKYKIKDGGNEFLIAFSDLNKKPRHFIASLEEGK